MAGIAAGAFASGAAAASVALAGELSAPSAGFAGRTKAASVTVPRKTMSLVFKPGQAPGAAFEHVQARSAAGPAKKHRIIISSEFRITNNILQLFPRQCEEVRAKRSPITPARKDSGAAGPMCGKFTHMNLANLS
jgi:hypothetical protein